MSLGKKIAVLFLILGICFSAGSYAALRLTIFPAFGDFERDATEQSLARVRNALASDLRALEVMNMEYSLWDQTYAYAQGKRPQYPEENLDPAYWHSVDTHMMLIYDARGRLLHDVVGDPGTGSRLALDATLVDPITPEHPLLHCDTADDAIKGLVDTRIGPLRVVSYPILQSNGDGPRAGTFLTGQFLTRDYFDQLATETSARIELHPTNLAEVPPRVAAAMAHLAQTEQGTYIEHADDAIHAYEILTDVSGRAIGVLEVFVPRNISEIGAATIRYAGFLLAGASAVFLLTALFFLQRNIVRPVRHLTEKIQEIQGTGDLTVELGEHDNDEVGALATEFSKLARRLTVAQSELESARDEALDLAHAKSEFLARMSHEIRTPMNGVLGMTELLRNTELKPKQRHFADTIYQSAGNLLEIINDILDFSKIEAGKLGIEKVDMDLRETVEESVTSLADQAHQKNLELVAMIPPDMQTQVRSDPLRLRQVLTNLIGNAIKFTDEGEVIVRVQVENEVPGRMRVRFSVEDTGIGISAGKRSAIFDSFTQEDGTTTRYYGGTGLGLAISSQIVELMGGHLTVESEPGIGSKFHFTLDFESVPAGAPASVAEPSGVAGKSILIVDDNATNREILETQLESWLAATETAVDADQALVRLRTGAQAGRLPDLAILDMHMPGMDGMQLARVIRSDPALTDVRMIVLSSVATPASALELHELDIAGQLTKPVRQSQLYDALLGVFSGDAGRASFARSGSAIANSLDGRVLVAEDNPVNQAVAIGILETLGLDTEVALNGKEAVRKASRGGFDAVLMDCQMPVLDGIEATRLIRRSEKETGRRPVPIVALTANALKSDREACLAAGMDEYLSKPFTGEQLHAVLSMFVDRKPEAAASAQMPVREAANEDPGSPPLDRSILDDLARLDSPGSESLLDQVIGIYLESSRELIAQLCAAVHAGDATGVRDAAHALKSSSNNVGAVRLAEHCRQLEFMAREGNLGDSEAVCSSIEQEYARVIAALEAESGGAAA